MKPVAGSVVFVAALAAGCGSVSSRPPSLGLPTADRSAESAPSGSAALEDSVADRVVQVARSLLAAPYRYAGTDPRGFDCSGLTSFVFGSVGVALPRTAESQASAGRWVAPDELARGDLVFFGKSRAKPLHVGVVVSAPGEPLTMIHSSSSRGVIETEVLTDSYWLPRLTFGRRVLE